MSWQGAEMTFLSCLGALVVFKILCAVWSFIHSPAQCLTIRCRSCGNTASVEVDYARK